MCYLLSAREREAALRRAIIRVKSAYFSWPPEVQERYRARIPDQDDFRIRQALLQALFHIQVQTQEDMEAALDAFDEEQFLLLNSTILPLTGVGEDNFFLNEWLGDEKTILDFETLYDYDYDDYLFQERARKEQDPGYAGKPYRGNLYFCWARLEIDDAFTYANLSSMAGYLYGMLDEIGFDKIAALIPHDYVAGKEHGKREGKGFLYDKRVDAGGMEGQLKELQQRYYTYLSGRYDALLDDFDTKAHKRVYGVDTSRKNDPHVNFVFSDKTALQAVRFRHFMRDCQAIAADTRELDILAKRERQAMLSYLKQSYQDILENFDPTLVKFRKKRKILLADSALKDLL